LGCDVGAIPLSLLCLFVHSARSSVELVMRRRANSSEETIVAFMGVAPAVDLLIRVRGNGRTVADVFELGLAGHFMGEVQELSVSVSHRRFISARRVDSSERRISARTFAES
jgi:hypothetical protein